MAKKIIKMTALLVIALSTVMSGAVLAQSEWWEPAYLNMQKLGYITGDQYGRFNPDNYITRAEMATIIGRITNVHYMNSEFSDVAEDAWYRSAVINVTGAGFFNGYEDGTFRPNAYITRAEAAVAISKVFPGYSGQKPAFADEIPAWAEKYVADVAASGIMNGYEDGTFRPNAYITRAEVAALLNNVIKNVHPFDTDISNKTYEGNLVIVWDNLTLKNVTVNGTLYITGAVDEDEIVIERVKADEIVINGANAVVKLLNTDADRVLVAGSGVTQLILSGNTTVREIVSKNNVKVLKQGFNGEIKSMKSLNDR